MRNDPHDPNRLHAHARTHASQQNDREFLVRCSYLEIYNETIIDLLNPDATVNIVEGKDKVRRVCVCMFMCVCVRVCVLIMCASETLAKF